MSRILIRCDASLLIGSGHVMRCRTLAREMSSRGAESVFLCRRQPGDLISLLEQEFSVLVLPEQQLAPTRNPQGTNFYGRELYAAWLGCSQQQDVDQTLVTLKQAGISSLDWIVVDHYGLDATWQKQVLDEFSTPSVSRPKCLVIDDLADRPHQADLLLDQNFFVDVGHLRYQGLVPKHCLQLLGPHYALLGPEYAQLQPLVPSRTQLRRVFVFFGGVDPDNITLKVLEALTTPELSHLDVDVVLGIRSPHRASVQSLVLQRPNTTMHASLPSLAGLIARADLAIGAGGATTWERACLGLPSLVVAIAANQLPFAKSLHRCGFLQFLGEAATIDVGDIRNAVLEKIHSPELLTSSQGLTDGFGVQRLSTAMLGLKSPLSLRSVQPSDEVLLLRWFHDSNVPRVHTNSDIPDLMSQQSHQESLNPVLSNQYILQWIVTDAGCCPLGAIHFERLPNSQDATFDLWLDSAVHRCGLLESLVRQGLEAMERSWGVPLEAVYEFQPLNQATFAKARFVDALPCESGLESLSLGPSRITLLSDSNSWLNDHLSELIQALWQRGHSLRWIHDPKQLAEGEVCLLLSCGRLLSSAQLALHRHNLVVHASALPKGQGWSPMSWQIIEGVNDIPITLFEANADLDSGPIYLQQNITLAGDELLEDWRFLSARATINLCLEWFDRNSFVVANAQPQEGESTYFRRRRPVDSELDSNKSFAEQFQLLRIVDNEYYPAFFEWQSIRYMIHITKMEAQSFPTDDA